MALFNGLFDTLGSTLSFLTSSGLVYKGDGNAYESDRAHTEMREDTAYQRAVEDMRKAGLNPYTIGASPANSSASNAAGNALGYKLQMLGYILDLQNLSLKNKKITNDAISDALGFLTKLK